MPQTLKQILKGKKADKFYVKPHKRKAREVKQKDIPKVIKQAKILLALCYERRGQFPSAYAIAHPQIKKWGCLRFFVKYNGDIVINPVITRHSNYTVKKGEGCMSYIDRPMAEIDRYHKIEVDYQTIEGDKLTEVRKLKLSGRDSEIFQHEINHLDGISIYDK